MNGGLSESYNMDHITKHCCEWMSLFLKDSRVTIVYVPYCRTYAIPQLSKNQKLYPITKGSRINYCPWCAQHLPQNLINEWFDILEKEYQLDNPDDKHQTLLVPEEFKTDEWWKKRGL